MRDQHSMHRSFWGSKYWHTVGLYWRETICAQCWWQQNCFLQDCVRWKVSSSWFRLARGYVQVFDSERNQSFGPPFNNTKCISVRFSDWLVFSDEVYLFSFKRNFGILFVRKVIRIIGLNCLSRIGFSCWQKNNTCFLLTSE